MEIPSLPTDGPYKFLAVGSLVFGVLGAPLSMTVNIDVKNDGAVEAAQFCVIGASGG